jgi:predicted aldo/keto reductase-like oxidoreductase
MQYREIGNTGEKVSVLGFGCMRFQTIGEGNENIDEELAIKQLRHAIDNGVNYVDTAYPYHGGNSELLVAKALKDGYREKVYLADKLPSWLIKSRDDMDKYLNEQLEKLETDHIDFFLLHALRKEFWDTYLENDVFDFIKKAKESGKIKHIGFSFHDELPVFKEIVDAYDWDFCQIQYNFMDEDYQAGLEGLNYAADKGIGVIIMEPLRGGSLTNNIPEDIQKIWDSADIKRSPAEWALRFVWNNPKVSLLLSGMNQFDHINENIKVAEDALPNSLTEKELGIIEEVRKVYDSRIKVDCTNCKYCLPCPEGVMIPNVFALYNNASIYNTWETQKKGYANLEKQGKAADKCIECGLCEQACPQNIPIREKLKEARAALT